MMPVFTVHAPVAQPGARVSPDRFVFVRDGFHFWAMAAAALWLLYHRLWLVLIAYLVLSIGLDLGLTQLGVAREAIAAVMILVALLMGFEAASLRRWTLSRGRWRQVDVVVADDRESAERRFFERWPGRRDLVTTLTGVDRGAPPPRRPDRNPPSLPHSGVLGLFPEPGGSR